MVNMGVPLQAVKNKLVAECPGVDPSVMENPDVMMEVEEEEEEEW
jgi:hypothetical protein